ncbi:MBOAT family O-acyltransferase, partial [Helicobacter didelphidarum]|uniref:MBOAT family O-acyltransferase n=1 Tax=Helicobacter didelphidarum TaxID=2040648 RepID=UPI002482DFBD
MDFFIESLCMILASLHIESHLALLHIALPLGISFFTITQIAYLVDCYEGKAVERNLINYALFVTFFPHLIAGPILHHKDMMPQFAKLKNKILRYDNVARGLFIFSLGLFKKVFIADTFAKWANAGYSAIDSGITLNIFEAWATSLSYTFQLYFDFSGYCDMAIGLGLLFNIALPVNFASPYKSLNISEFWRRWHITLGRFLKDYLYIPLGGSRNTNNIESKNKLFNLNRILTLRNLFIVVFISGVWHGAGIGFIIWGILHGLAMCVHRMYRYFIQWAFDYKFKDSQIDLDYMGEVKKDKENVDTKQADSNLNISINTSSITQSYSQIKQGEISSIRNTESIDSHCIQKDKETNRREIQSIRDYRHSQIIAFLESKTYKILCWILTFNFVNIAWIFFRAENLDTAISLLKSMFGI